MWKGASLRAWVALGMTMAIVPLAASAVAGYVMLKCSVPRFDEALGEA